VIKSLTEKYPEEAFLATVTSDEFNQICENYSAYVSQGNSACKAFASWSSLYRNSPTAFVICQMINANYRLGSPFVAIRSMLPWFFAYDRVNYARYLLLYWLEMSCVQDTHPGNAVIKGACMINHNATCAFVYIFQLLSSIVAAIFEATRMAASGPQRNINVNKRTHCIALWLIMSL
jgi:hypothetical protein